MAHRPRHDDPEPRRRLTGGSMRLAQFVDARGERRVGRVEGGRVIDITNPSAGARSTLDLIELADRSDRTLDEVAAERGGRTGDTYALNDLNIVPAPGRAYLDLPLASP